MSRLVGKPSKKLDFPIDYNKSLTENIFGGIFQFFTQFHVYPSTCDLPISGKFGDDATKIRNIFGELRLESSCKHIFRGEGITITFYPGDASTGYKLLISANNTVSPGTFRLES